MSRKGIALLVVLMVIVLAGTVLATVLAAVNLEIGATRAAVVAVQAEAALFDLHEDVLADSVPLGSAGAAPAAWRSNGTSTVFGARWAGDEPDSLVWLYLSVWDPAVRTMMMVAGIRLDTSGVSRIRPLERRTNIYPFF